MTELFCKLAFLGSLLLLSACFPKVRQLPRLYQTDLASPVQLSEAEAGKLKKVFLGRGVEAKEQGYIAALLGNFYSQQKNFKDAAQYFAIAAEKVPDLEPYFRLAEMRAAAELENFERAKNIANALLTTPNIPGQKNLSLRVKGLLSEIAVKEKNYHQIIKTHEDLLKDGFRESDAFLFNLAFAMSKIGEQKKANEVYKRLLINFPSSTHAERVEKINGLAQYRLTLKEQEKRFNQLIAALAYDKIIADVQALMKMKEYEAEDLAMFDGMAIKALVYNNQFERALARAKHSANLKKAPARAWENYAWALGKMDRSFEASQAYWRFFKLANSKEDKAKGCFLAGFSLYEASLYSMAHLTWQSCQEHMVGSPLKEDFMWYQALSYMLENNYQAANRELALLTKNYAKSSENEKYRFFQGYSLVRLNQPKEGSQIFRSLVQKGVVSYYSLLARNHLHMGDPAGARLPPKGKVSKIDNEDCEKAMRLFNLGFLEDAKDLVLASNASRAQKLELLEHMGLYHEAWKRAPSGESKIDNNRLVVAPAMRAAFPQPHRELVERLASQYNVKKSLLYAIIRAESGFFNEAQSYRGALGLMQMMPHVAQELAQKLSLADFENDQLKEPKTSIELGAMLLALLHRQFEHPHLVIAAYNAGSHQVSKWSKDFGDLPVELFIERMPYKQSRNYVKEVSLGESNYFAQDGNSLRLTL
jgi:soluble lytic murein transglycosylase